MNKEYYKETALSLSNHKHVCPSGWQMGVGVCFFML
jgi:hypothetical protein